jgi:hypothetical protein
MLSQVLSRTAVNYSKIGESSVPLTEILSLEEQIRELIENLENQNLFLESEDEKEKRIIGSRNHALKMINHLKDIQEIVSSNKK